MIDAHQHFWSFDPIRDSWIDSDMAVIQRDFLPRDLRPLLERLGIEGTVVVQSDSSENENDFQLTNAAGNDFIKGVVGWIDLQAPDVEDRLAYYQRYPKMKGFRHVLQGEKDRALMLKPAFKRGIEALKRFGYTYDILIFPDQLAFSRELVTCFPDQPFVIDHIAKPYIKEKRITEEWRTAIRSIAAYENVYCKLSGVVTEADWKNWTAEELRPYFDTVVEAFGMKRLMFGSDWPVCLVAATYERWWEVLQDYFSGFTADERVAFFGGNATQFYKL